MSKKKQKRTPKVLKILLIFLLLLVILGLAVFSAYLVKTKGNIKEAALSIATDFVGEQAPIFILLLGVSEDISTTLTDTIMLAGYNPQTQNAFVVSIPRDTYIGKNHKSANGYDKINSKYQISPQKTIKAVEELTGVSIDYYVVIKNNALVDIVDSIGGVKFDVPINMNYDDVTQDLHIHLKSGLQILNGEQAEQLVRFRHNNDGSSYPSSYGDNDYGRMRTQREFIKILSKQLISLDNIPKVKSIATAVFNNLETDITLSKVLAYVPFALKLDIENNFTMVQLPGQSNLVNELWFYVPNYEKIGELFDELVAKLELENDFEKSHYKKITKSNIKIENMNKKAYDNKVRYETNNKVKNQNSELDSKRNNNIDSKNNNCKYNKINNYIENDEVEKNNNINSIQKNIISDEIVLNTDNLVKNEFFNNSSITTDSVIKSSKEEKNNNVKNIENKIEQNESKKINEFINNDN